MGDKKKDVYAELGRLKEELEALRAVALESAANEARRREAEAESAEWKRTGAEAVAARQELERAQIFDRAKLADAALALQAKDQELAALRKQMEALKLNAKFDASAREGQASAACGSEVERADVDFPTNNAILLFFFSL